MPTPHDECAVTVGVSGGAGSHVPIPGCVAAGVELVEALGVKGLLYCRAMAEVCL